MPQLCLLLALLVPAPGILAEGDPGAAALLLDEALALAQSVPDRAERADAVGRVAAEIARHDPKRALALLKPEMVTHEQARATARAAEVQATRNRMLGFATLLRVHELSTVIVSLARIVAMETLVDLGEAQKAIAHLEPLTVRWMVEREVTRVIWADLDADRATAVDTAVQWASGISDPVTRYEALAYAAEGAATVDPQRAQDITQRIPDAEPRDLGMRLVVQQVADRDLQVALELLVQVRTPLQRGLAGAFVVDGLVRAGRVEEALKLADTVRRLVDDELENPLEQGSIRQYLALALIEADPVTSMSLAADVWPPVERYTLQCRLATFRARENAEDARQMIQDAWIELRRTDAPLVLRRLAAGALAAAQQVAPDMIDGMLDERPELSQEALPEAVRLLGAEDPDAGLKLVERIQDSAAAEAAQAQVAETLAATDPDAARAIADRLTQPALKSAVLVALALATEQGEPS